MLTAITLFLLSASSELVGVVVLQKGCMDRFRNGLNSSDPWVSNCVNAGEDANVGRLTKSCVKLSRPLRL